MAYRVRYRDRAVAIIITDGYALVVRRNHPVYGEFFVFPGGGIEAGEDPTVAVRRELREETGVDGAVRQELMFGKTPQGFTQHFYLVTSPKVPVSLPPDAEENDPERRERLGTYEPMWIALEQIAGITLQPEVIKKKLLEFEEGGYPDGPIDVGDLYYHKR